VCPEELTPAECLQLLAQQHVGRVVFTDRALPAVQPVSYLLDEEEVLFRTPSGSTLATASRNTVVGFHIDRIDPITHTGWSVLGIGEAYEVVDPTRLAEVATLVPTHGSPTHRTHTICIPLQQLTGRHLALHTASANGPTPRENPGQPERGSPPQSRGPAW
jgi:nitroimidazol reductase NimA-like FMN-containing flavoprotein (pyridoxamine 5'-phosphate oxidase superfamily)